MSLNTLLMSDEMIKERSALHGNIDPKLLYPDIKVAQDMYILPVLGTALYDKLQAAVNAGDWTGLTNYKNLMDRYIVDALMYYTLAELPMTLGFQFYNRGIIRKTGEDTETPDMSDLISISNGYRNKAEWYAKRLKLYLQASLSQSPQPFPEYMQPGTGIDTIYPDQNSFSMPIYLGDVKNDPYCNRGGFTDKPYTE